MVVFSGQKPGAVDFSHFSADSVYRKLLEKNPGSFSQTLRGNGCFLFLKMDSRKGFSARILDPTYHLRGSYTDLFVNLTWTFVF